MCSGKRGYKDSVGSTDVDSSVIFAVTLAGAMDEIELDDSTSSTGGFVKIDGKAITAVANKAKVPNM